MNRVPQQPNQQQSDQSWSASTSNEGVARLDNTSPVIPSNQSSVDLQLTNADERQWLEQLFRQQVFNREAGVLYMPIRHHSPGCSHHLLRTIAEYEPEVILIEGPEAGNPLIPVLADPATQTPVSLYYTYEQGEERGAFYFPMLAYSPEYIAICEAARRGIKASFIDLNYRAPQTLHKEQQSEDEKSQEHATEQGSSYQDETLLTSSSFIQRLCTALHCRSFDELWDRWFEAGATNAITERYIEEIFLYCSLSRLCYTPEQLEQDGTLARERHMLQHIEAARQQYQRVLVITGGFHTLGLLELQEEQYVHASSITARNNPSQQDIASPTRITTKTKAPKQGSKRNQPVKPIKEQIYPMVYTFEEADRLNGYASGMPYVAYYDEVWKRMQKGITQPGQQAAIRLLSVLMKELRQGEAEVSTSDAIEAYSMLQGLAAIRGKPEGSVYELLDGVTSCFIKGEETLVAVQPLQRLQQLLTGNQIGEVASNPFAVPIVEDFKKQATACKLKLQFTGRHKKVLDLYTRPQHRQISRLFHCMTFLGTELAVFESGPDWVAYRDINLMRETWTYSYSSFTEARLIENSIYGGTIAAAATRRLETIVAELPEQHSGQAARCLLRALLMGLEHSVDGLLQHTRRALRQDGSFLSLSEALVLLERMYEHRRLLGLEGDAGLPELLEEAYQHTVAAMDTLEHVHPDDQSQVVQSLKQLHMLAMTGTASFASEPLYDRLQELLERTGLPASLEGVSIAILSRAGMLPASEITDRARSYMRGTPQQMAHTAAYLQGVFAAARDAFLYDKELLNELNSMLARLSHDDFVRMIPELRMAFTFFTPAETRTIATRAAELLGESEQALDEPGLDEEVLLHAQVTDKAIRQELARWGLL
ncbi:DUF5682 family protein [Paenibacillus hunanensis]|uniref:DUF5682 family protein n=1 Tax=Paenibacillus hunanensis TaxID=539262 RepID=UPI0020271262|nr:DUF5682 family protein [Paenibacillus hunanensis]MCL9660002.1 DUF5682 family protein [Paenibacillus hunanensis]